MLCVVMTPPLPQKDVEGFWQLMGIYAQHCDGVRLATTSKFFKGVKHPRDLIQRTNSSGNVFVSVIKLAHAPESISNLWEKTYTSFLFAYQNELSHFGEYKLLVVELTGVWL